MPSHPIGWGEACKGRYGRREWSSRQRTEDFAAAEHKRWQRRKFRKMKSTASQGSHNSAHMQFHTVS